MITLEWEGRLTQLFCGRLKLLFIPGEADLPGSADDLEKYAEAESFVKGQRNVQKR
jgi:hypothetical protein